MEMADDVRQCAHYFEFNTKINERFLFNLTQKKRFLHLSVTPKLGVGRSNRLRRATESPRPKKSRAFYFVLS